MSEKETTNHAQNYREKGDRIEAFIRPKGTKADYKEALRKKGTTIKDDLEDHIKRTIAGER